MSIGRWELHTMSYVAESVYGTDPGSGYAELWHNTHSLSPARETLRSERALGNRRRSHSRLGLKSCAGDIVCEWVFANHDPIVLAAIGSSAFDAITWDPNPISITLCNVNGTGTLAEFTDGDAAAKFADVLVGDMFITTEATSAGNNGVWICTKKTSPTVIEAQGLTTPVDVTGDSMTFTQVSYAVDGTTETSFTIWSKHTDLTTPSYLGFNGMVVNTMQINLTPDEIVKLTFGMMGHDFDPQTSEKGVASAATTYYPFDCLTGVVKISGVASTKVMSCRIDVGNNYKMTKAIGSTTSEEAIPGKFDITGQMSLYFDSVDEFNKFWAETLISADFTLTDPDSNIYHVYLPSVKWTSFELSKSDDGPCTVNMNFEACTHTYLGTIFITKDAA